MKKQLFSILAALTLCLTLLPAVALAETAGAMGQESHTHYLCGGDFCTEVGHICAETTFEAWTSNDSLPEKGVYYLTQDVTLLTGKDVAGELTLDLNGYSIICNSDQSAIYVMSDGCFTLTDCNGSGSEHKFAESSDGSHRWVLDENGSITVNGGVITHSSANIGWGVVVNDGSMFNMYGGTVCGNHVKSNYGAGVDVYDGAFTMYGGAIKGNAATYGSGVFVNDNCIFTMYGGEIDGNSAIRSGGGVNVSSSGVFTMAGGTITGNAVTGNTNNVKVEGGGVHVEGGTFTMSGDAKITGNMVTDTATPSTANGGGVFVGSGGTLRLSGSVEIKDNGINSTRSNTYLSDKTAIEIIGSLTGSDSTVGVTLQTMPSADHYVSFAKAASGVKLADKGKSIFFIDNDNGSCKLTRGGSELLITNGEQHIHPICGDTCSHQTADGSYEHPNVTWTATDTLPTGAGHWYLTQNVEGSDTWTPVDGTFLDLNGCKVTMTAEDKAIIAVNGGAFTLCDCRKGGTAENGKIAHSTKPNSGKDTSGAGCGVSLLDASNAQFTMYGGEISNNWIGVTAKDSGGFKLYGGSITGNTKHGVWQMRCPFDMYDGSITKNGSADNGTGGSGVCINETTFTMHGGTISDNISKLRGGGVCVNRGTFEMSGGEITQNISTGDSYGGVFVADAFKVSGDAKITGNTGKNVYLGNDAYSQQIHIIVSGELSDSACIGVSTKNTPADDAPVTIATVAGNGWIKAGNFISDNDFYRVITADDGKSATLAMHEHQWSVETDSTNANVLQEHCTVSGCSARGTLTLNAGSGDYDASPREANLTALGWHSSTENYVIVYEKKNDNGGFDTIADAPTAWGDYRASITVGNVIATKEFSINPYTLNPSDFVFSVPGDLTYDSQLKTATVVAKAAIASAVGNITVKYYDESGALVAAPTDAGTYTVMIDVAQGEGCRDVTNMFWSDWEFTIAKADITVTPDADQKKTFDESDPVLTYAFSGQVSGETPAFTGALSRAAGENAGSYAIGLGNLALANNGSFKADNYMLELSNITAYFNVEPAAGGNLSTENLTQKFSDNGDHSYTPDWSGLPSGQTWNYICEYSVSGSSTATLTKQDLAADGSLLTYAINGGKAGDVITVTLKAQCDNYEDFTITLSITLQRDAQQTLTLTADAATVVYGQTLKLSTAGGSGTGAVTYGVISDGGEASVDANGVLTPIKAGSVRVIATKAGDSDYNEAVSAPFAVTITKAASAGEPKYNQITADGRILNDAALTLDGSTLNPNAGTLEWIDDEGNTMPGTTVVEANRTYKWRFTPADANYEILVGEIELYLYHVTYGGGGSSVPTYPVSTPDKMENGSVTISPKNASKGDTVTITVTPDSGYELETITATDKNGNELKLTDKGNGKYTFTMPSGKAEVKASFMEDNSLLSIFYDVPNDAYYYEAVKWAVRNGITDGVGNDLFGPDLPCTRAQIVTFLWRAAGSPEPKGTAAGMTDVVSGSYYEKAVAWAIGNGITTGTTANTFSPDATCIRAQAVTFLARALNAKTASAAEFSDVPTDSYFAEAVAWAASNGVTEGVGNGLFAPDNNCTRGQIVTFLYRAYMGK